MGGLTGQGGAGDIKSSTTTPPKTSAVTLKDFNRKKTYIGEQVFVYWQSKKISVQVIISEDEVDGEWKNHKSKYTTKREKAVQIGVSKKRKFSPGRHSGSLPKAC